MQRYFKDTNKSIFSLSEKDSYHIKKVMRMNKDDLVEVVINNTLYICKIIDLDDLVVVERKEQIENNNEENFKVTIAQSLLKEQKMDYILQKSCELGVDKIIPLKASRSVVKLDKKENKKIERWNRIMKEASEQSKRLDIPRVEEVKTLKEIVNLDYDLKILCTVNEKTKSIKKVLNTIKNDKKDVKILLVVGPEGGFTNEEERIMMDNDFIPVTLGNRVLRSETVSLFIMSIISYEFMR